MLLPLWLTLAIASATALAVALALDRWLGEPPQRLHPVVWMGRYLGWIGGMAAARSDTPSPNWVAFWAGALGWIGGALLLVVLTVPLQDWALRQPPWVAGIVIGVLLKPMLAWRMLRDEVAGVEAALGQSLARGRQQLARVVSRDVMRLDATEVREAAIESLAENFNDSVVAPLLWFAIAGLPGAVLYRFANTADAMWGYRGFRGGVHWEWAGKWAARADDVLSWLPARITALLFWLAAMGLPLRRLRADAAGTPSPNGGWPMAAMALALGVQLRKPGVYALNATGAAPGPQDTARAIALCRRSLPLAVLLVWAASIVLHARLWW